ncbi:MAG: protein kinase family protein [Verrucomicrobiota bacterium]
MLQPGESLDGYRVIRLIGSGGFGAVWLCQSEALGDLRALKFIPAIDPGRIEKEFDALCRYRTAAGQLRSPSIIPIEHVNRRSDGLFYIMPLADGYGSPDPLEASWCPLTLAAVIEGRREEPTWFTSEEIKGYITPILQALQLLSDAGLVHRDVKPDNILFLNGTPCLGDISLLGEDSHNITRRGTPGYSAPSWFVESGGHPDMFGVATTLYSLLTGNPPDKMGRTAFRWPPQGENSLPAPEKQDWQRIHRIIRRAVDERPAERFGTFDAVAQALNGRADGPRGSGKKGRLLLAGVLVLAAGVTVALKRPFGDTPKPPVTTAVAPQKSDPSNPGGLTEKELADYKATASLAALYFDEKNYQASLEMLKQLTTAYPVANTFPYYSTLRAQCLYKLDRPEEAHAELRRGLFGKRLDLASFGERMKLWDALGDLPGAEAEVTRIIEEASPITLHYTARARLRLQQGNFDGAEKDIHAASTLDDDPARAGLAEKLRAGFAQEFPDYARYLTERGLLPRNATQAAPATPEAAPSTAPAGSGEIPEMYRADLQRLDGALDAARKILVGSPELLSKPVDAAVEALQKLAEDSSSPSASVAGRLHEIQKELEKGLRKIPPSPTNDLIAQARNPIDAIEEKIRSLPKTTDERVAYDWEMVPLIDKKIGQLDQEAADAQKFRTEQAERVTHALSLIEKNLAKQFSSDTGLDIDAYKTNSEIIKTLRAINARIYELIP